MGIIYNRGLEYAYFSVFTSRREKSRPLEVNFEFFLLQ